MKEKKINRSQDKNRNRIQSRSKDKSKKRRIKTRKNRLILNNLLADNQKKTSKCKRVEIKAGRNEEDQNRNKIGEDREETEDPIVETETEIEGIEIVTATVIETEERRNQVGLIE